LGMNMSIAHKRKIRAEEVLLVHKAITAEMAEIRSGKIKTIPFSKVLKEAKSRKKAVRTRI